MFKIVSTVHKTEWQTDDTVHMRVYNIFHEKRNKEVSGKVFAKKTKFICHVENNIFISRFVFVYKREKSCHRVYIHCGNVNIMGSCIFVCILVVLPVLFCRSLVGYDLKEKFAKLATFCCGKFLSFLYAETKSFRIFLFI